MENNNLLRRTKHLLRLYGFFPKKRLGQNFTVDSDILQRLVLYASLTENDVVLEVGAGFGFLTQLLSGECKRVVAVEVDPTLVAFLRKHLSRLANVELLEGNILTVSLPLFNKVVAAPPYSISSPLLFLLRIATSSKISNEIQKPVFHELHHGCMTLKPRKKR